MSVLSVLMVELIVSAFVGVMAAAALSDIRARRIPNWMVLTVVLLYVGWIFTGEAPPVVSSLEAALLLFAASAALYFCKLIGAGDSKLMTVVGLFVGLQQLPLFLFAMSLAGGALALLSLASSPQRAFAALQMGRKWTSGRDVPYGVAIAIAGVFIVVRSIHLA